MKSRLKALKQRLAIGKGEMMNQQIKAAGYIRVSSKEQIDGESLHTQRQSIKNYCKANDYKLTNIFADEGISGGTVKDRHALLQCLHDGQNGKFDVLVIHRLSRFGRNARELLNNQDELSKANIQLRSISEGIDFNSKYGRAMLGMLAIVAELERDIIREQMLENRIARGKRGIPTSGRLPFGRKFNRETNQWELDQEAARLLQWVAEEYLKGESLREIAWKLKAQNKQGMSYHSLLVTLAQKCGDTWTVHFKGEDPITYTIPRILDEATIQKVRDRLEHNRTNNRQDIRRYVLSGFIRCEKCGKALFGQRQINAQEKVHGYYRHPKDKHEGCQAFTSIPIKSIENAVFQTIFENIADVPAFEKAIADGLPDENYINLLHTEIQAGEKQLKQIEKGLDKLVDIALSGALEKETIKNKEQSLLTARMQAYEKLEADRDKLHSLPDVHQVKQEAETIRRQLLEEYSGKDRLMEMTFEEKKTLLHWLFDGKDKEGTPYGIYVFKKGRGKLAPIDYFLHGRITGLRTLKGDDINYYDGGGDNQEGNKTSRIQGSYKGNKIYKTNSVTRVYSGHR